MLILLRPHLLISWLLAVAVGVAVVGPARGEYVSASNLGANFSFNTGSSYTLTGPATASGYNYNMAVQFTQGGTGPSTFSGAGVAVGYRNGANAIDVRLFADSGGLPGTLLESIRLTNAMPTSTSVVFADSTLHPTLVVGQRYWLAVVAVSDAVLVWSSNNQSQTGRTATQSAFGAPATTWTLDRSGNLDPAYVILANAAAVPDPESRTLVACGLVGILLARRVQTRVTRRRPAAL